LWPSPAAAAPALALPTLPQAGNAPLDQLPLQAPGVAQDSYGQIHVRGDPDGIPFRLEGVELPEGLAVFGQSLQTRFARDIAFTYARPVSSSSSAMRSVG